MKNKNKIWYLGYFIALLLILLIALADFPREVDLALCILFSSVFVVSHTQLFHSKMLRSDEDYKINIMDERNIAIKEKAGNAVNRITMVLLGVATVVFIALDYIIPAIVVGTIIFVQLVILIVISNAIEAKM